MKYSWKSCKTQIKKKIIIIIICRMKRWQFDGKGSFACCNFYAFIFLDVCLTIYIWSRQEKLIFEATKIQIASEAAQPDKNLCYAPISSTVSNYSVSGQWRSWSDCEYMRNLIRAFAVHICPKTYFCMVQPIYWNLNIDKVLFWWFLPRLPMAPK